MITYRKLSADGAFRERHADLNRQVLTQPRGRGWMRDNAITEDMRAVYYAVLRHPDLVACPEDRAAVSALLNEAWAGVHGWAVGAILQRSAM
jgi:hypothetical protein